QLLQHQLLQRVAPLAAQRLEAEADLAIGADVLDKAAFTHAAAEELEGIGIVDQAPVAVVDDGLEADIGAGSHQQIDPVAHRVARGYLVEVAIEVGGGGDPPAVIVQV